MAAAAARSPSRAAPTVPPAGPATAARPARPSSAPVTAVRSRRRAAPGAGLGGAGATVGAPAGLHGHELAAGPAHHAQLVDHPAYRGAAQVHDHVQRGGRLAVHRGAVQARGDTERLQPGVGTSGLPVGVQGAPQPPSWPVLRAASISATSAPRTSDDQPVGAHPERLLHQVLQRHPDRRPRRSAVA